MKRITLQVEDDLHDRLNQVVQHGFRRHLMENLIVTALDAIERDGPMMLGALIGGQYKLVKLEPETPQQT